MEPDRMPSALAPLLERARDAVQRDPLATGLVVNGSVALGTADDYSDLDLVVLYGDGEVDLAARARQFVAELGDVLACFTGEHVGEPDLVIALLAEPFVHVDVKCARVGDQARRVEDGVVAWQRGTAVADARAGSSAQWPQPDPQWIEDRVWVWLHYGAAKAARGELLECLDALGVLRSVALGPLIAMGRGAPPSGVRRLERLAPDLLPQLHATLAGADPLECLDALSATADLYRMVRPATVITRDRAAARVAEYLARLRTAIASS